LSTADDKPGTLGGFPDPPATSPLGKAQLPQRADLPATFARVAALPPDAVVAVFRRYGRPLAVAMPAPAADDQRAVLEWAAGAPATGGPAPGSAAATVRVLQVMGYGDVIPNDYFVLEMTGEEPVAVAGPFFAAALEALARAAGIA
jgi:hypothetical protein